MIKLISVLLQVGGFLRVLPVSCTNKTDHHDTTEILLKVASNTITLTPWRWHQVTEMWGPTFMSHLEHVIWDLHKQCSKDTAIIDKLVAWGRKWEMGFDQDKCNVLFDTVHSTLHCRPVEFMSIPTLLN